MEKLLERGTWVFDLDNTLYDGEASLFKQVGDRMTSFIVSYLGLEEEDARKMRKDYFHRYGTTLRGLMEEHGVAPEAFMDYIHEIDYGVLKRDDELCRCLLKLGGMNYRLLIYTNGPLSHAERVLGRIGMEGMFEGIFDIERSDWFPKPMEESRARFMEEMGVRGGEGVMFDDLPCNLVSMAKAGMSTVWVKSDEDGDGVPEVKDGEESFIDYETLDLRCFLQEVLR
jgi:putative hydrolase of the HAD superfamily